jgi:tetratricopeptide (TPR) repeat protein
MPQTTYMQRHGRHDHGFTTPDPMLTKEHGVPDACNRCHTDKDADWSMAATEKWYGKKMNRPARERARWIAKARKGDDAARGPLTRELAEGKHPFWQAVAAGVLERWVGEAEVRAALVVASGHADPLVRENAAHALTTPAMQGDAAAHGAVVKLLEDPARAVRVRAAWALRESLDPASRAGKDLLAQLHENADQPTGALQQGSHAAARGDVDAARAYYAKAVTWEPNAAPARDALANLLIVRGETARAAEQYDWAAKLAPRDPTYPYKLALTYVKLNDRAKAREAAERAVKADPKFAPARELVRSLQTPG